MKRDIFLWIDRWIDGWMALEMNRDEESKNR